MHRSSTTVTGYACLVVGIVLLFLLAYVVPNPEPALPKCPTDRHSIVRCEP